MILYNSAFQEISCFVIFKYLCSLEAVLFYKRFIFTYLLPFALMKNFNDLDILIFPFLHFFSFICLRNLKPQIKSAAQTVDKVIFVQRKVLGNEEFPKWNPQTGFTPVEENSEFQGF